jgi:restriction system protein
MVALSFPITCPSCGHQFQATLERLQANPTLICPGCGGEITVTLRDEHGGKMTTELGPIRETYGARGSVKFSVEVTHKGLNKHRVIQGTDLQIVTAKMDHQAAEWHELWAKKSAEKEQMTTAERKREQAADRTAESQLLLETLRRLLVAAVETDATINWDRLRDRSPFPEPRPEMAPIDPPPSPIKPRPAPDHTFGWYQPKLGFLDKLIPSRKREREREAASCFERDLHEWEEERDRLASEFQTDLAAHKGKEDAIRRTYAEGVAAWERRKSAYRARQLEQHASIDNLLRRYQAKEPEVIAPYCRTVLASSDYPDCIPREGEVEFTAETGVLVVDLRLPAPAELPTLTEVKYVLSTDSFTEKHLSEPQQAKLYDEVLYQITLRTLHELFRNDPACMISIAGINGIVTSIDRSTGKEVTACILSVQAPRAAFDEINLAKVDPKACFRQLKGVGSSKLHSITPVAPILQMRRDDRRFIPSYGVSDQLHEGFNLASMDWEDFEHLIREIFEKEFTSSGGEVRVTQASRDGGVDAVAFDPDPIRGGKIVIQAKRYAYTVGVSAVRDLYGTLMNEGATKGILVTTSDYGPDAYEFANGKPITLLNGSNLLHLLAKHGTKAHINLVQARQAVQSDRK